jgi:hypothetical protein
VGCGVELVEEITARRAELEQDAERLGKELAEVRSELERVAVAEHVVNEIVARRDAGIIAVVAARPPSGRVVPQRRDAAGGAADLPASYRLLLEIAAAAKGPVTCAQVSVAAGLGEEKSKVEGVRSKLNRLVERGWLRAGKNGTFALMP